MEKLAYWSQSSLNKIINCALQYFFQRVAKIPPAFQSSNLVYGSSIHAAASWLWRLRKEGTKILSGEIQDVFSGTLEKLAGEVGRVQYDEGYTLDVLIKEGRMLIDVLVSGQRDDEVIKEVDLSFEIPLTNSSGDTLEKLLVGEIDLLVAQGEAGHLVIKDLKTSKKRYPEAKLKHDIQASSYVYALGRLRPGEDIFRFQWDVLLKNRKPELVSYQSTRSQEDFDRLFALAQTADRLIESGAFLPNRGSFFCKGCPFQRPCDEWQRGSSTRFSFPGNSSGLPSRRLA